MADEPLPRVPLRGNPSSPPVLNRAVVWGMLDINPAKVGVDNPWDALIRSPLQLTGFGTRLSLCTPRVAPCLPTAVPRALVANRPSRRSDLRRAREGGDRSKAARVVAAVLRAQVGLAPQQKREVVIRCRSRAKALRLRRWSPLHRVGMRSGSSRPRSSLDGWPLFATIGRWPLSCCRLSLPSWDAASRGDLARAGARPLGAPPHTLGCDRWRARKTDDDATGKLRPETRLNGRRRGRGSACYRSATFSRTSRRSLGRRRARSWAQRSVIVKDGEAPSSLNVTENAWKKSARPSSGAGSGRRSVKPGFSGNIGPEGSGWLLPPRNAPTFAMIGSAGSQPQRGAVASDAPPWVHKYDLRRKSRYSSTRPSLCTPRDRVDRGAASGPEVIRT